MLKVLLIPALDDSNIDLIKKSCPDMNLLKVNKEDLTQEMIDEADVIVGNPPYMKSEDMKNITPLELPLYKTNYDSTYKQFDKYFLGVTLRVGLSATIFLPFGTKRISASIPNAKAA